MLGNDLHFFPSGVTKNLLVNRLSSKNMYAIITLTAQVGELISTNSWTGYH